MNDQEEFVHAEQIRIVFAQTFTAAVGSLIGGAIFVWGFWGVIEDRTLLIWFACLLLVSASRVALYVAFRRRQPDAHSTRPWGKVYTFMTFVQGALWGTPGLVFIPLEDPIYSVVVAMWMIGLSASSVSAYSAHLKVLLAFFIPVMLPGTLHLFFIGGQLNVAVATALCVYVVIVLRAVRPINKLMIAAIGLNFKLEDEIEGRKKVEGKLREMSLKDGLTGISNRRHFDEALDNEYRRARRASQPVSLILLDIDNFKGYNDAYGHLEGDACLHTVGQTIDKAVNRPGDLAARYGGEEFAVILSNTDFDSACAIAETIRESIQALKINHPSSNVTVPGVVTISGGVASVIPDQVSLPESVLQQADDALYQAKSQGRNRVVGHDISARADASPVRLVSD